MERCRTILPGAILNVGAQATTARRVEDRTSGTVVERDGLDKSAGEPICTTHRVARRAKYMDVLSENRCTVTRKRHQIVAGK